MSKTNNKANKKTKAPAVGKTKPAVRKMDANKTKRLVIILVSIFVGISLILGVIIGCAAMIKRRSYLISYKSVGVDEGVAAYFASAYKNTLLRQLANSGNTAASDTEAFWSSTYYGTTTWGDMLEYYTKEYIKQIVAANAIFDMKTKLTSDDKTEIALAVNEILSYRAGGSVDEFNKNTEAYGFDYDDFKRATEMIYKADYAFVNIFGENGGNIASDTEYCDEFFKTYARVKLIFIRTETTFVFDAEGNRVKDDLTGYDKLRDLNDEEKAERAEYIARLDACIEGINNGSVDPAQFDALALEISEKYKEGGESLLTSGYYFNTSSDATYNFASMLGSSSVINKAYEIDIDECALVEFNKKNDSDESDEPVLQSDDDEDANAFIGKCYMMRIENEASAYLDSSADGFFADFYLLASTALYQQMLDKYAKLVVVNDKWDALIEPALIPKNSDYVARF